MHNPGEKATETRSSQAPTTDNPPLLFPGICHAFASMYSSRPVSSPMLLMHLPSQSYVDTPPRPFVSPSSAALNAPFSPTLSKGLNAAFLAVSRGPNLVQLGTLAASGILVPFHPPRPLSSSLCGFHYSETISCTTDLDRTWSKNMSTRLRKQQIKVSLNVM